MESFFGWQRFLITEVDVIAAHGQADFNTLFGKNVFIGTAYSMLKCLIIFMLANDVDIFSSRRDAAA